MCEGNNLPHDEWTQLQHRTMGMSAVSGEVALLVAIVAKRQELLRNEIFDANRSIRK